jgi:hypothetical protein
MSDDPAEQMRHLLDEAELDSDRFRVWLQSELDRVYAEPADYLSEAEFHEWCEFRTELDMEYEATHGACYVPADDLRPVFDA